MKTALHRDRVQHILKYGERHTRKGLAVCVLKSDTCCGFGRFAILISKKVVKGAVLRNRLRRVLREVVQTFDRKCVDIVVLCRRTCDSEAETQKQLQTLLCEVFGV